MTCYNSELPIGPPGPTGPQGPPGINTINVQQSEPTTTNDVSEGYEIGSTWFDETSNNFYICLDNTLNSAVWNLIGGLSGSWTGIVTNDSNSTTTFIANSGRYTVVNNVVTCSCKLQTTIDNQSNAGPSISLPIPPSQLFNDNVSLIGVGSLTNTSSESFIYPNIYAESRPGQFLAQIGLLLNTTYSESFTYNLVIQYTI